MYPCKLLEIAINYHHQYELGRNYFFVPQADDCDIIISYNIDPQIMKISAKILRAPTTNMGCQWGLLDILIKQEKEPDAFH
jgi:hypothetical protein